MAEFCSMCDNKHFDIDLVKIALDLKNEYSTSFLCEGCNRRGIYKDENGLIYLAVKKGSEITLELIEIEKLQ